MEDFSLRDMAVILLRRKMMLLATTAALFAIALVFVLNWSNYRATATVQIEQSSIDANVTNPNEQVEILADQRINQVQQKVTSLDSLAQIIKKFNLYPGKHMPIAGLTEKMRNKIKVEFVSGSISNPAAAQKQTAEQLSAIAFNISFDYNDPQLTQQVTEELVTRFMDEDINMRRKQAEETSAFLAAQITALESAMAGQEKAIADFQAKHGESGPAALLFNQQSAATVRMNIQNIESQLSANEGTQGALRAQLATVDPYTRVMADGQLLTTPAMQLKALETQYTTLTSQYGPEHPDVLKARRQIAALKAQIGHGDNNHAQLEAQAADLRTNLEAAKSTKGGAHPDVIALQRQLKKVEAALAASPAAGGDALKRDADNPAYLQLTAELRAAEEQHKSLSAQRDALARQEAKYEQNIAANPLAEQDMAKLSRDYDNAQLRYRELKEKKMTADMNEQLEASRKGQHLVLINPPDIPADTHPRFLLLLAGALVMSVMGGLSTVLIAEASSQSVHGASHLAGLMGVAPLVTIPHIFSEEEKRLSLRVKRGVTAIGNRISPRLKPIERS